MKSAVKGQSPRANSTKRANTVQNKSRITEATNWQKLRRTGSYTETDYEWLER